MATIAAGNAASDDGVLNGGYGDELIYRGFGTDPMVCSAAIVLTTRP